MVFDRWGDPDSSGSFAWYPFGGEITGYRTFEGVTIPSGGRLGWFFGTDRWPAGEFFRYRSSARGAPAFRPGLNRVVGSALLLDVGPEDL
jgi:hypothetical protein